MAPAVTGIDGLPPAELGVPCAGNDHVVRWERGLLSVPGHPDAERERALIAMGAPPYPCLGILDSWTAHATDLEVLGLAPRGPGDVLAPQAASDSLAYASVFGGPVIARSGVFMTRRHSGDQSDRAREIGSLLHLGGGLATRLVLGVVAEWCDRLDTGDARVADAGPALHAALYGRLRAGLATWLGRTDLRCDLTMIDPGDTASVMIAAGHVEARLPFHWLRDVWCLDTTTVMGRFTVAATRNDDTWQLTTIDAGGGPARTVTMST